MSAEYYDYLNVFSKVESDTLLYYRVIVNYKIELEPGYIADELRYNPFYKISLEEAEVYKNYIINNLRKGFIESNYTL